MQDQFGGAAFQLFERDLAEQRDGVLVELTPAGGVQVAKEPDGVLIPAPPEVACQGPESLLGRPDEAVQGARLADDRGDLAGRFDQHADLVLAKGARLLGLDDEDALQDATVDQRHTQEGVVVLFAGLLEELEAGMVLDVGHGDGKQLLGNQAGQAFAERHAQHADGSRMKAEGGGQDQVRPVGLQQVGRADIGFEARGDQRHDIHQRIGGLAALPGQVCDLFQREEMSGVSCCGGLGHWLTVAFRCISEIMHRQVCPDSTKGERIAPGLN